MDENTGDMVAEALEDAEMVGYRNDGRAGEIAVWNGGELVKRYTGGWEYNGYWTLSTVDVSVGELSETKAREFVAESMGEHRFTPIESSAHT